MRSFDCIISTDYFILSSSSLCTASVDKQLCHMAAGFEDSTVVLWSLNGYENYGRKPFQSFDDRLCQWSINNCNRILTDDLSDYDSDDDVEANLKDACDEETDYEKCSSGNSNLNREPRPRAARRRRCGNKYRRSNNIREQWKEFAAKSCSENSL